MIGIFDAAFLKLFNSCKTAISESASSLMQNLLLWCSVVAELPFVRFSRASDSQPWLIRPAAKNSNLGPFIAIFIWKDMGNLKKPRKENVSEL